MFAALIAVPTGNGSPYPLCLERGHLIPADEVSISSRTKLWISSSVWQASWHLWSSASNTQNKKLFKTGVAVSHQYPKNTAKAPVGILIIKQQQQKKHGFSMSLQGNLGAELTKIIDLLSNYETQTLGCQIPAKADVFSLM